MQISPPCYPRYRIGRITELTLERLREMDAQYLLIDVDCTLKRYSSETPEPDIADWLQTVEQAGFSICLVSNGRGDRIHQFAKELGYPCIAFSIKPLPFGPMRAIRRLKADRRKTLMIGDQMFTDIPAGRIVGVRTVLVAPIHPEEEPLFARCKRAVEKIAIRFAKSKTPWDK